MTILRSSGAKIALIIGTIALILSALSQVLVRSVYLKDSFADRTAGSLQDPGVREFVADRVTDALIGQKPDLVAVRPFVLSAVHGLVGTRPFEGLVRQAAGKVHDVVFSEGVERVVIALPDVGVLVREVLGRASPALAEKIPSTVTQSLATVSEGKISALVVRLLRLGLQLRLQALAVFLLGIFLLGLSIWYSPDRRRGTAHAGVALSIAGGLLLALVPVTRLILGMVVKDPLTAGAAEGLASAYLGATRGWGFTYLGVGLIAAAGGAPLLARFRPLDVLRGIGPRLLTPPVRLLPRLGWALVMLGLGIAVVLNPTVVAAGIAALGGLALAYAGIRELFAMLEQWVASVPALETVARRRGWSAPALASILLVAAAGLVWVLLRKPTAELVAPTVVTICNGSAVLCDRRVDEVVFPAAHNAQSNVDSPDWMFPHHQAGIQTMLRDGVRALAIDIHYGFAGGSRIKTDLAGLSAAKLTEAVGEEAAQIAERIRNTLVGADEGKRDLYFCHGFCELGAYDPRPSFRAIREFMVANPDEVIILIIEDYVTPEDLGRLFEEAELTGLVFQGPAPAQWPTLRELITSNQRLIVFTERGTPGVPWLLPTLGNIQETPYTFKTPEDFSCRPNRGDTTGSLFLINHWLETTPSPKPSNAAIVNAHDVLLARARECQRERKKLPNILMVDFYRTGDLVGVVAELNGAAEGGKTAGRQGGM
ncbi:MAG TPA: hypothetical protein VF862_07650 [Gemmatimonadales bacterium]